MTAADLAAMAARHVARDSLVTCLSFGQRVIEEAAMPTERATRDLARRAKVQ
jgi:hypothetical protein